MLLVAGFAATRLGFPMRRAVVGPGEYKVPAGYRLYYHAGPSWKEHEINAAQGLGPSFPCMCWLLFSLLRHRKASSSTCATNALTCGPLYFLAVPADARWLPEGLSHRDTLTLELERLLQADSAQAGGPAHGPPPHPGDRSLTARQPPPASDAAQLGGDTQLGLLAAGAADAAPRRRLGSLWELPASEACRSTLALLMPGGGTGGDPAPAQSAASHAALGSGLQRLQLSDLQFCRDSLGRLDVLGSGGMGVVSARAERRSHVARSEVVGGGWKALWKLWWWGGGGWGVTLLLLGVQHRWCIGWRAALSKAHCMGLAAHPIPTKPTHTHQPINQLPHTHTTYHPTTTASCRCSRPCCKGCTSRT